MVTTRPVLRRPAVLVGLALAAVLLVVALAVFQPWKLVVDRTVDEAAPVAVVATDGVVSEPSVTPAAPSTAAAEPAAGPAAAQTPVPIAPEPPAGPVELSRGEFISHEHASSGSVVILQLPDGSRVLRLEGLDTSDGPLLKVWLTDAPVIPGRDGWFVFDDGAYADLGELKGNVGSSNYPIPADVDLSALTSVSIWCERFSVSFAAGELRATT